eukprot:TRINITY_DN4720_c0_g1_i2.p1 TRINITY_DN4720_c0_g1~~TRINITY_DN4720_c0_g1_i2.p1  ORF type:complete len:424 (+),score=88.73 TRINITY_DN4720_c0_g1_i2:63-1334(+)
MGSSGEASRIDAACQEGKRLLQANEYEEAVEKLSEAISLAECRPRRPRHLGGGKDEKEMLLMLSNRSAAHRGMSSYSAAIADANRCIEIDNSNYRGYWRLGVALRCNAEFKLARQAFEDGIGAASDADGVRRLRAELADTDRIERERLHKPSPRPPQAGSAPDGVVTGLRGVLLCTLRITVLFTTAMFAVANTVGTVPLARATWLLVLLGSAASHTVQILAVLGPPTRGDGWPARLLSSFEFTRVLMCMPVLITAYPVAPALFPVVAVETVRVSAQLRHLSPVLHRVAVALCGPTARLLFGKDATDQSALHRLQTWTPFVEIAVAFLLTLQLLSPSPSPFACFSFWVLLQVRHMVEAASSRLAAGPQLTYVQDAWQTLDSRAEHLVGRLPVVGGAYRAARSFFKRQVKLPEKGEKPSVRCNVM